MNSELLLKIIEIKKINLSEVASELGLTRQALYNKINKKNEFKSSEIKAISKLLNLSSSDRDAIFFSDYVDKNANNV